MEQLEHSEKNGMKPGPVLVFGAGGHGKTVISVLQAAGMEVEVVVDDDPNSWDRKVMGYPVVGPDCERVRMAGAPAIIGVGDNGARREIARRFPWLTWVVAVHPRACVYPTARLGPGTVVLPGAVVGTETTIGAHVIVSAQVVVGHESLISDYAHLAVGAMVGGGVTVGEGAQMSMGSIAVPKVRIGEWCFIGAGAVVVKDVPSHAKAVGMPARPVG